MNHRNRILPWVLGSIVTSALLLAALAAAETRPAAPAKPAVQAQPFNAMAPTEKDLATTQAELIKLLRLSPKLTTVIEHDPSLLANQEYVSRNNPQLGQFLASHPEIVRNPEFYLFTHMNDSDLTPDEALEAGGLAGNEPPSAWATGHRGIHQRPAARYGFCLFSWRAHLADPPTLWRTAAGAASSSCKARSMAS